MFNIPFKNPLEAETVSERRERKAKESEGSLRSSKSSARPKLFDRAVATKNVTIFGLGKASKAPPAPLDFAQIAATKDDVDTGPAELPGSPVILTLPPYSPSAPSRVQSPSKRSFAPSVDRQEAVNSSTWGTAEPAGDTTHQTLRQWRDGKSHSQANTDPRSNHTNSVDANRIARPIQSSRSFIAQLSKHRTKRYPAVRYPSTSSTGTTARSDTSCTPVTTPGTSHSHDGIIFFSPAEYQHRGYIHTSEAATLNTSKDDPGVKAEPLSSTVPAAAPEKEWVQPTDLDWPTTINPLLESLSSLLLLIQHAPCKAICQRLNEDWEGTSSDIWKVVNYQKKLLALLGLKRLRHLLDKKNVLPNWSDKQAKERDETAEILNEDRRRAVYIGEDGVEGWLQAATFPHHNVSWLQPPQDKTSLPHSRSPPGITTNCWTDIPTLPYPDSSIDLISSRNIPILLRSSEWPTFIQECARVLRPGGVFEITIIDPIPRNCGPLFRKWTTERVILGLERRFLVTHPAMIVPVWLDDVADFGGRHERHVLSFPAVLEEIAAASYPSSNVYNSDYDLQELRMATGRYFYEMLYGGLLLPSLSPVRSSNPSQGSAQDLRRCRWWWTDPMIVRECQDHGTFFELVTYTCQKDYKM